MHKGNQVQILKTTHLIILIKNQKPSYVTKWTKKSKSMSCMIRLTNYLIKQHKEIEYTKLRASGAPVFI
jgi:hypothetical protein